MNFQTAISTCFSKYGTFKGRATRSEFWWFYLFTLLMSWGATIVGNSTAHGFGSVLSSLISLAFFVPTLAVGCRRLHDIGRTGWWQLLMLTMIGVIVLIVWWATPTKNESSSYGQVPDAAVA
jgi:uncharacterized membrane protein YhaH (DUF805 family)